MRKPENNFFAFFLLLFLAVSISCFYSESAAASRKRQPVSTIKTGDGVVTELWDGKVLTATFRAGMCFEPTGVTRGVLILRHANGKEDVYHLNGVTLNGEFELSHASGHEFKGEFSGPDKMKGKVKLANGLRVSLKGERHRDVPLAAEDCAPLP